MDSTEKAFTVFLMTRDPVKVAAEWAPRLEEVADERPALFDAGRVADRDAREARKRALAGDRRLAAALADVEQVIEMREYRARVIRAHQIEIMNRKAA